MTIENIKQLMDGLDIAALLPDIMDIMNGIALLAQIALFLAPLILLGLGLYYFLLSPKEANFTTGYRCYYGMGSEEAWRFTQRLAGVVWTLAGITMTLGVVLLRYRFAALDLSQLMWTAIFCLLLQGAIVLVLRALIHFIVLLRYDRKGNKRLTWKQLWKGY
ncbi:MAG: SdpI family protein [Oscillospiraceae bacterium]|nr:SdpI family protein [Oscillospiraceae bacterium]